MFVVFRPTCLVESQTQLAPFFVPDHTRSQNPGVGLRVESAAGGVSAKATTDRNTNANSIFMQRNVLSLPAVLQIPNLTTKLHAMQIRTFIAVLALAAANALGMSQKVKVTVRFHTETNKQDGESFAMPVHLQYQNRDTHLSRIPAFSEKQLKAIFPFRATDGSWGCSFQLNESGRIRLETMSSESRGTSLVVFIGTKTGQHQIADMIIDRIVSDGLITVPRGITDIEMIVLRQQFAVIGEDKAKPEKKEKKDDVTDWRLNRDRNPGPKPAPAPQPVLPALPERKAADLPRLAD